MSRVYSSGGEARSTTLEGGNAPEVTGTVTMSTANPHLIGGKGGKAHWRCGAGGTSNYVRYPGTWLTGKKEEWSYFRWYVSIDKAPAATREILRITGPESRVHCSFKVTTGGNLLLFNSANAEVKSFASAFTFASYLLIECAIWPAAAGNGKIKVRLNEGEIYENASITLKNEIPEGTRFGWIEVAEGTATIDIDDIAINTSEGSVNNEWCGAGVIRHLLATSDKARTGWVVGAAATTNLFKAIDNEPPVGVVFASKTAESQVYDPTSSTTDTYEANLESYETGGVSGTVKLVQGIFLGGTSAAVTITIGGSIASNPEVAEVTLATGTTAAGTHPTGWKLWRTLVKEAPTVTLATQPVLKLRKGTASTTSGMVEYAALLVEWNPGGGVTPAELALAAPGTSNALAALSAPTQIPLQSAPGVANAAAKLTAATQIPLQAVPGEGNAAVKVTAPALITPQAPGLANAALAITAPTRVPLAAAPGIANALLAITAPTRIPLDTVPGLANALLALTAPTRIPLQAIPGLSNALAALSITTPVPLQSVAGLANALLTITAPTRVPLQAVPGTASAALTLTAPALMAVAAPGLSNATLALTAPTRIPFAAAPGIANALLALTAPALIAPSAPGTSNALVALYAPTRVLLDVVPGLSNATVVLQAGTVPFFLIQSPGVATALLGLYAPTRIPLAPVPGLSAAALAMTVPTQVPLAPVPGLSSAQMLFRVPTQVPLAAVPGQGNAVLVLTAIGPAQLGPLAAAGIATAAAALYAPTRVALGAVAGLSNAIVVLFAPKLVPLGAVPGTSGAVLVLRAQSLLTVASAGAAAATLGLQAPSSLTIASAGASDTALRLAVVGHATNIGTAVTVDLLVGSTSGGVTAASGRLGSVVVGRAAAETGRATARSEESVAAAKLEVEP